MRKILFWILKIFSRRIFGKYQPEVIGITGSVGKTSAKEAVFAVLSGKFKVRRSEKNYNNEIGLPLAIIGVNSSPGSSLFGWLKVFFKALKLILFKDIDYPRILILEMGADKPGDIDYLLSIVRPKVGIITRIGQSHLEAFKTEEAIKKEKGKLIKSLTIRDWAVVNGDDETLKSLTKTLSTKLLTFGFGEKNDLRARLEGEASGAAGVSFFLSYQGEEEKVFLPNVLGRPAVYAALAGAAVGIIYGLNLKEITGFLRNFRSPRGRLNILAGIKGTVIIDDTYNASPQSALEALEAAAFFPLEAGAKRTAVLGDMLELGNYTEEGHQLVGRKVAQLKIDRLVAVGERARAIARGAEEEGMPAENIVHFAGTKEAGLFVQDKIKKGDLILVKGSQGARMERIVKEIMAKPLLAGELLVRQGEEWNKR